MRYPPRSPCLWMSPRRATDTSVTVSVSSDDDSRYAIAGLVSTLTIPTGEVSVSVEFTIDPTDNNDADGNVTVTFTGDPDVTGWPDTTDAIVIIDDDSDSTGVLFEVTPASIQEDASGTVTASVSVSLNGAARSSDTSVAVSVSSDDPGRYTVAGLDSPLTIAAGQTTAMVSFTIDPTDNDIDDGDLVVTFTGDPDVTGWANATDSVEIIDDDLPATGIMVVVLPESVDEDASGAVSVSITVSLEGSAATSDTSVAVQVSSDDPGRYTVAGLDSPLTIAAGQTTAMVSFTIDPTDNDIDDGDLTVTFTADPDVSGWADATDSMSIVDDDGPATGIVVAVIPSSVRENVSGAVPASITVSLDGSAALVDTAVAVSVSSDDSGRYTVAGVDSRLTITAGETSVTDDFTIDPIDNDIDDGDLIVRFTADPEVSG